MTIYQRQQTLNIPQTRTSTFDWSPFRPLLWTGAAIMIGLMGPFIAWLLLG